jgi:hypothetical protein
MRKKEGRKQKKSKKPKKKKSQEGWTKDAGHGDDETPRIIVIL